MGMDSIKAAGTKFLAKFQRERLFFVYDVNLSQYSFMYELIIVS